MEDLIARFGSVVIFLGACIEGGFVLVLLADIVGARRAAATTGGGEAMSTIAAGL